MEDLIKAIDEITSDEVFKIVLSNKLNKDIEYKKVVIEKKEINKNQVYQIERFTEKQVFHENISIDKIRDSFLEEVSGHYKQATVIAKNNTYDLKISKKGKVFLGKKPNGNIELKAKSHNKEKNYILKEGEFIKPLIDLGVFTKEGKVVKSKYDKYKQINRFLEIIDDEVKKSDFKELTILDFGCGKSYLTFVLYHYFVNIKKIKVNMIGLDLKKDVIEKCNKISKEYGYENLKFELGDINGYKYTDKVDMVITLHACDTATDYALYNAIKWNTKMIFSVPCCQHEFNSRLKSEDLNIIGRYGIIKERIAALMTDSVRGNLLEAVGYKTQILEFIDIAHSPKNILIRATKGKISKEKKEKLIKEVDNLSKEFNLESTLYKLLKEDKFL